MTLTTKSNHYPSWLKPAHRESWDRRDLWLKDYIEYLEKELDSYVKEDESLDQFDCNHLQEKDFFKRGVRYQLRKSIKLLKDRNR